MTGPEAARRILADTQALLLDFDGPVCNVFHGFPARRVADQLRALLVQGGHAELPRDVRCSLDPFDVLRYAARLSPEDAQHVEAAFRAHELEAVRLAEPTTGAHELIRAWKAKGKLLAIVSNNSAAAVETYLFRFEIAGMIDFVSGRVGADPALLKPSPDLVLNAVHALAASPSRSAFIGDSVSDIEAALASGTRSIGYANRPGKRSELAKAGADAIIESLAEVSID